MQCGIINCSWHAVYDIPMTYLFYNWEFIDFLNVYLFLRERQSMNRGGAEERETESKAGSRL